MPWYQKIYNFFLDAAQTILLAASVFIVIYIFLVRPYQVSGLSMYSTFHDKEYVFTNVVAMYYEKPNHGDVIVFHAPIDAEKDYIKRVIGVPTDSVMVSNGNVYLNGKQLDETMYVSSEVKTYGGSFMQEGQPVTVPQDEYLVMGDNRPASSDSRQWGFVKVKEVIGKSFYVYFPFNRMRLIKNPYKN